MCRNILLHLISLNSLTNFAYWWVLSKLLFKTLCGKDQLLWEDYERVKKYFDCPLNSIHEHSDLQKKFTTLFKHINRHANEIVFIRCKDGDQTKPRCFYKNSTSGCSRLFFQKRLVDTIHFFKITYLTSTNTVTQRNQQLSRKTLESAFIPQVMFWLKYKIFIFRKKTFFGLSLNFLSKTTNSNNVLFLSNLYFYNLAVWITLFNI